MVCGESEDERSVGLTVHSLSLHIVPALMLVDLVLKFLLWIHNHSDLVIVIDEVSGFS